MQQIVNEQSAPGEKSDFLGATQLENGNEAAGPAPLAETFDLLDLGGSLEPQPHSNKDSDDDNSFNVKQEVPQSSDDPVAFALSTSSETAAEPQPSPSNEPVETDLLGIQENEQEHAEKNFLVTKNESNGGDEPLEDDEMGDGAFSTSQMNAPQTPSNEVDIEKKKNLSTDDQQVAALDEETGGGLRFQSGTLDTNKAKAYINGHVTGESPAKEPESAILSAQNNDRVERLENELASARAIIASLKNQQDDSMLQQLQTKLEEQMGLKAEAENKARLAAKEIIDLKAMYDKMADEIQDFHQIKANIEQQMNAKAEAENNARVAKEKAERLEEECKKLQERVNQLENTKDQGTNAASEAENKAKLAFERIEQLENDLIKRDGRINTLEEQIVQACQEVDLQRHEAQRLREEREELIRKEMSLTNRLNAAKMKESDKSNLAEQYETEIKGIEDELKTTMASLLDMSSKKEELEQELEKIKNFSNERVMHAEHALAEERRLNEDRKRKMKVFVENKTEELRQAKEDNDALQFEVNQTNRSLLEINNRLKQLQAQYVQSQSRNRELQMDLNRIKKDSENLHKFGDTLEMKLSKSATETEEHKNKRLAAKHELMTVLRSLEAEKKMTAKLRDTIKFTFTPKALSQQKLLQENVQDFEVQLQKLAQRLGKPVPPSVASELDRSETEIGVDNDVAGVFSDADIDRLIAKLERETQAVSQCIMEFAGNLERMHMVLDASGERTCVSVIAELLMTGGNESSPAALQPGNSAGGQVRLGTRHRYGSLPLSAAQE